VLTRLRSRGWAAALAALAAHPAPAAAQGPAAAAAAAAAASVAAIPAGARVRVHTAGGERFHGRLLVRGPDSLVLSAPPPAGRRGAALAAVDTRWVQRGTAAVPVGVTGAVTLGALGLLVSQVFSGGDYPECPGWCVAEAAARGAGIGFLLGAAVGAFVPRWHRHRP